MISTQLALGITLTRAAFPGKDSPLPVEVQASATNVATDGEVSTLQSTMAQMVCAIAAATDAEELDWRLGEQVGGGPLQDLIEQSFRVVPHLSSQDLEVPIETLDPSVRELLPSFLTSVHLSTTILGALEEEHGSTLHELLFGPASPDLQEVLYGEDVPPAVQSALYDGCASYLCLLVLLDERPRPHWLDLELRRRARDGQRHHLRLLVALASEAGVEVPASLSSLEPLDLEEATRQADEQRRSIDTYLDSRRPSDRS